MPVLKFFDEATQEWKRVPLTPSDNQHTHTPEQAGAAALDHTHTLEELGAQRSFISLSPEDVDLDANNFTSVGIYRTGWTSVAARVLNIPVPQAFVLEVLPHAGVLQRFTTYQADGYVSYQRNMYNGVWGTWRRLLLADEVYPVGAIYQSLSATSPATLFGGTWAAIGTGRFLVAAGSGYAVGATGGAASVALTVAQMPSHGHRAKSPTTATGGGVRSGFDVWRTGGAFHNDYMIENTGGGAAHENRPPYYAVYMWRRTA